MAFLRDIWSLPINSTKWRHNDVKLRHCGDQIMLGCWNDDYIILWNFGGHVMSGFKVIEGGLSSKRLLSIKRLLLDP